MSHTADLAADKFLREQGFESLALHTEERKRVRPALPWDEEFGRKYMSTPKEYYILDDSGAGDHARMNGHCIPTRHPDRDDDSESDLPAALDAAREWVTSAMSFLLDSTPDSRMSAKQIALCLLLGDERFHGRSLRSIAESTGFTVAAISAAVIRARATLFSGLPDSAFSDCRPKSAESRRRLATSQASGKHWRRQRGICKTPCREAPTAIKIPESGTISPTGR